jgi:hypothetical protein
VAVRRGLSNRQLWLALIGGVIATVVCFAVVAGAVVFLLTGGW